MAIRDSQKSSLVRVRARVYDAPSQAKNRAKLEELVTSALDVVEDILTTGEPHEQLEASRIVLQAAIRVYELQIPETQSAEADARLDALFENPPPALLAHLEAYRARENAREASAAPVNEVESTPTE